MWPRFLWIQDSNHYKNTLISIVYGYYQKHSPEVFCKKGVFKIFQNLEKNACAGDPF